MRATCASADPTATQIVRDGDTAELQTGCWRGDSWILFAGAAGESGTVKSGVGEERWLPLTVDRRPPLPLGSRIGKYEVRRVLGLGGQACAYLAFDPDLERQVVLKIYHEAEWTGAADDVLREGRALARVKSPYVAQCYGAERCGAECLGDEKSGGAPYLVLEYVPGRTLVQLQAAGGLKLRRALELVARVAEGLAAVHDVGLLHRDVKPSNIIVGDDGVPRLVDFGLAEPVTGKRSTSISGTLAYMAPEQARGETERVGPASDVFGAGAVLYELLTGRPPYVADALHDVLEQAREGRVPPILGIVPRLPPAVAAVCMRCLSAEPQERFASARELRAALESCLEAPRRPWKRWSFGLRLGKRRFQFELGTTLAALVVAALVGVSQSLDSPEPAAPAGARSPAYATPVRASTASTEFHLGPSPSSAEAATAFSACEDRPSSRPRAVLFATFGSSPAARSPASNQDAVELRLAPESQARVRALKAHALPEVIAELEGGTGEGDIFIPPPPPPRD